MLPCNGNLAHRGMRLDSSCAGCSNGSESQFHALLECPASRAVWLISPLGLRTDNSSLIDIMSWMNFFASHNNSDRLELFAMLQWASWNLQNEVLFYQGIEDPEWPGRSVLK